MEIILSGKKNSKARRLPKRGEKRKGEKGGREEETREDKQSLSVERKLEYYESVARRHGEEWGRVGQG